MVRRRGEHEGGTWSTPGGHLEFGEDPVACAARETLEETGVTIDNLSFLGITNDIFPERERHYVTIWMCGEYLSGDAAPVAPDEVSEVGWFAAGNLPSPLFRSLDNLLRGRVWPSDLFGTAPELAGFTRS